VLWGGGIYNWFDPLTLLRAIDKLRARFPEVRLYFLGLRHPNPQVGEMKMTDDAVALAHELGLVGTHVFFNEDWVDYDDRQNYLLEADIGVSTHLDHVDRVLIPYALLDYLWASLPIVATAGDSWPVSSDRDIIAVLPATSARWRRRYSGSSTTRLSAPVALRSNELPPTTVVRRCRPLLEFCRHRSGRRPRRSRASDMVDSLQGGMWKRGMEGRFKQDAALVRRGEGLTGEAQQRFSLRRRGR
jgi:hypothetical protein